MFIPNVRPAMAPLSPTAVAAYWAGSGGLTSWERLEAANRVRAEKISVGASSSFRIFDSPLGAVAKVRLRACGETPTQGPPVKITRVLGSAHRYFTRLGRCRIGLEKHRAYPVSGGRLLLLSSPIGGVVCYDAWQKQAAAPRPEQNREPSS